MKQPNGHEIIQLFERFAPKKYAMEGDKIGLQIGTLNRKVKNVLITLDVLEKVVDEAIEKGVQLIIAHHPVIFRPLASIRLDEQYGRMIEKILKHDLTVYAAHTNLDIALGGVNDMLASQLQLENTEILVPIHEIPFKKLVCFVPKDHIQSIVDALGKAGAGAIGNYSYCSFSTEGIGRFLPGENTNPFIGETGKLEEVEEIRIETIFPETIEKKVLDAMLKVHPYEEPAYDIYPLDMKGMELGLGRIGTLKEEMTLEQFAHYVKEALQVNTVRVVGNLNDRVKKVAVLGGDGNKYYTYAKRKGADVYITGDLYYHTAHDAQMIGLNIIDPGHHIEKIMKTKTAEILQEMCKEAKFDVNIIPSALDTDPFQFI